MKKIKEIRELKRKIRVVGEAEPESEEDASRIVSSEIPLNASEADEIREPVSTPGEGPARTVSMPRFSERTEGTVQREEERINESALYESRVALEEGSAESARGGRYDTGENVQTTKLREVEVGKSFAMSPRRALLPEDQVAAQAESKFSEERREERYETGRPEEGGRRERMRYPWEV